MREKRTAIGKFIHATWTNLNIRCGKYRNLQTKEKCKTYENIKITFSREEFKFWCYERKEVIESLKRPSLDRINSNKDYSLDNIQILDLTANIGKEKLKFTDSTGTCYRCKEEKSIESFVKDKRRKLTGRATICKQCEVIRKKKSIGDTIGRTRKA